MYKSYPFIEVNLSVIRENYSILCKVANNSQVAAVVKANSYGLGAKTISKSLYLIGCRNFFVYSIEEGIEVRSVIDLDAKVFILQGIFPGEESDLFQYNLTPVINTYYQVELLYHYVKKHNLKINYVLHVDKGINRLGMRNSDMYQFFQSYDHLSQYLILEYIMSHLAESSNKNSEYNLQQLESFRALLLKFNNLKASFANSSGIFLGKEYHFDLVRSGAALYGINPTADQINPMSNPIRWVSKIIQVVTLDDNSYIGYNLTYSAKKGTKIATIILGYADGFAVSLSNKGKVFIDGIATPVVGRISMELVTIDVSHVPNSLFCIGQEVEVIGHHCSANELANLAQISPYELLTDIGKCNSKTYINF